MSLKYGDIALRAFTFVVYIRASCTISFIYCTGRAVICKDFFAYCPNPANPKT